MEKPQMPEMWMIEPGTNRPEFMRMTDGVPTQRLYTITGEGGRVVTELWLPLQSSGADSMLERARKDAVLMCYSPIMFWVLERLGFATDKPEAVAQIANELLEAMREGRADANKMTPEVEAAP